MADPTLRLVKGTELTWAELDANFTALRDRIAAIVPPVGPTGPQGAKGDTGATGAAGSSGSSGTGIQGPVGPTGPQGPAGAAGSSGSSGSLVFEPLSVGSVKHLTKTASSYSPGGSSVSVSTKAGDIFNADQVGYPGTWRALEDAESYATNSGGYTATTTITFLIQRIA